MIADQEARDRIRDDLDTTLVVEAAAGTGKTSEMILRILALIERSPRDRSGTALSRLAAVTFTEKAAGELKLRLRTAIEERRANAGGTARENLDDALSELEVARVSTIHGLCADLLREHPVEARVDPLFDVLTDADARRLLDLAFDGWFQTVLADPPEGVRRVLRREARRGPRAALRSAVWSLAEHRDFAGPWRLDRFDRHGAIDLMVERLRDLGSYAARARDPSDPLLTILGPIQRFIAEVDRVEELPSRGGTRRERDHDGLEAGMRALLSPAWRWDRAGRSPRYAVDLARVDVIRIRDEVHRALKALIARCDAEIAPLLQQELRPVLARYEEIKDAAGKLDFLDLLIRTRDLLAGDPGIRARLHQRLTHLLVDEFQDTDPLQADIVLLLAASDVAEGDPRRVRVRPGALFIVGDPKQSIYRFRRADIAVYDAIKERLREQGAAILTLSTSFRSDPRIQRAVNASFAPIMTGGFQANHVPLDPFRPEVEGRPAVVALPIPAPYGGGGRLSGVQIEKSLSVAVGAWIDWLVKDSGWRVHDPRTKRLEPVAARHVCLLFRRLQSWGKSVAGPYVAALEQREIPHVLLGGRALHDREEVMAIRAALTAIEWPDDALSVYATLRGPLLALSDESLLLWTDAVGGFHPLRPVEAVPEGLEPVAEAMALLADLHRERNRRPIAETLGDLLARTRAHAGFASWHGGAQALANVLRVGQIARSFESGAAGATSFRAFVEHLHDEAERGEASEAPVVEEDVDGVRIMTVHKAKGLEFPVVILCDPAMKTGGFDPSHHIVPEREVWLESLAGSMPIELQEVADTVRERELEEERRILYVAATRASDVLVVPVIGDNRLDGWHAPLYGAVYPGSRSGAPEVAAGCPPFGPESMMLDGRGDFVQPGSTTRPGQHEPAAGGHRVVWWDPAVLELEIEIEIGVRRQKMFSQEGAFEAGAASHEAWRLARDGRIARGALPSRRVRTPTEIAHAEGVSPGPVLEVHRVDRVAGRPHGTRFGTLVHAVLAEVPLSAPGDVEALAAWHARRQGASGEEAAAAAVAVRAALGSPLLQAAASSPDARREVPILLDDQGSLIEGIADLVFRDGAGWRVVDFKTDAWLTPDLEAAYRVQVDCYVRAVARATGEPARGALLLV